MKEKPFLEHTSRVHTLSNKANGKFNEAHIFSSWTLLPEYQGEKLNLYISSTVLLPYTGMHAVQLL